MTPQSMNREAEIRERMEKAKAADADPNYSRCGCGCHYESPCNNDPMSFGYHDVEYLLARLAQLTELLERSRERLEKAEELVDSMKLWDKKIDCDPGVNNGCTRCPMCKTLAAFRASGATQR